MALAKQRGGYTGHQRGTTKAAPARARALRQQGRTVLEIAPALGVKARPVYNDLRAVRTPEANEEGRSLSRSVSKVDGGVHGHEKASQRCMSLQEMGSAMERRWPA